MRMFKVLLLVSGCGAGDDIREDAQRKIDLQSFTVVCHLLDGGQDVSNRLLARTFIGKDRKKFSTCIVSWGEFQPEITIKGEEQ